MKWSVLYNLARPLAHFQPVWSPDGSCFSPRPTSFMWRRASGSQQWTRVTRVKMLLLPVPPKKTDTDKTHVCINLNFPCAPPCFFLFNSINLWLKMSFHQGHVDEILLLDEGDTWKCLGQVRGIFIFDSFFLTYKKMCLCLLPLLFHTEHRVILFSDGCFFWH